MDAFGFISVPTLVLATGLVGFAIVGALALLADRHAKAPGYLAWTTAFALHTLGLIVLGVEQAVPTDLDLTIGNLAATLSVLAYVRGAARLADRRAPWGVLLTVTGLTIAAILVFTHLRYDLPLRVTAIGIQFLVGQAILISLLARGRRDDRSRPYAALLAIVTFAAVTNVGRVAWFALTSEADDAGGASSIVLFTANLVFFSTSGLLFFAVLEDRARRALGTAAQELEQLARIDGLTGLANRRHFDDTLATEVARSRRYGRPLSLAMIDLDHFKPINDAYGHLLGDDVLRAVAAAIRSEARDADTTARFGGEELAVLLPECGPAAAREVAERIRRRIAELSVPGPDGPVRVTVSAGVATSRPDDDPATLAARADAALYAAKRAGRDRVVSAEEQAPQATTDPPAEPIG